MLFVQILAIHVNMWLDHYHLTIYTSDDQHEGGVMAGRQVYQHIIGISIFRWGKLYVELLIHAVCE